MQPTTGTRPAREQAADTDRSTGSQPAAPTLQVRDHRPRVASPRSPSIDRPRITSWLRVKCFGVRVDDMCLYRPRGPGAEPGPYLFERIPWPPIDAPGPPIQVARRDLTTSAGIAARVPRAAGGRHDRRGPSRQAARTRRNEPTENRGDGQLRVRDRAPHASRARRRHALYDPDRATRSLYVTSTTSRLALAPLTALPFSYSLLILMPVTIPLAAAPPPAFQPHAWAALPAPVCFASRGRGVQRVSGGPPFLESPGVKRNLGPEAGLRPVGLLGPTRRHRHQETDAQKPTGIANWRAIEITRGSSSAPLNGVHGSCGRWGASTSMLERQARHGPTARSSAHDRPRANPVPARLSDSDDRPRCAGRLASSAAGPGGGVPAGTGDVEAPDLVLRGLGGHEGGVHGAHGEHAAPPQLPGSVLLPA